MLLCCWWGGVGGWGMLTYLVLRTWSIATLLRSLGSLSLFCGALQGRRPLLVWDIGVARAQKEGKPPPESYSRIKKCGSFEHLRSTANNKRTLLLTDGAKCYPKMAWETNTLHEYVAHNRDEFEKTIYRRNEKISCHTGTIDAAWSAVKNFIPKSLSSKSKDLLLYVNGHSRLQKKLSRRWKACSNKGWKRLMHILPKTHTKRKFGQICVPKFGQMLPIKLCVSLQRKQYFVWKRAFCERGFRSAG